MAWRTTATFSARAGRVSSISAIVGAEIAPRHVASNDDGVPGQARAPRRTVGEVNASRRAGRPAHLHDAQWAGVHSRTDRAAPSSSRPKPLFPSPGHALRSASASGAPAFSQEPPMTPQAMPLADGLYDPRFEHD